VHLTSKRCKREAVWNEMVWSTTDPEAVGGVKKSGAVGILFNDKAIEFNFK
jgi:hypothetical protein